MDLLKNLTRTKVWALEPIRNENVNSAIR